MSGRRLGGGRILGSGKGLAPPIATPSAAPRARSPFAPSDSSLSLGSHSLSPPVSISLTDPGPDIGSSVSLGTQAKGTVAPSTDLVTLLQLNRHIDDNHQELPEHEQNEVNTWFDKQVLKAKRFQPLSLINQKLRGLDVFESNESSIPSSIPHAAASSTSRADSFADPDDFITRSHWQRGTNSDRCTDPTCGKSLGSINGSINCRKCGKLFCEEHTMYQMKLSRSANHEPVRGYWSRVCETCYKSREGYNDHTGVSVDHTAMFAEMRRKRVERQKLEVSRLEKRLTKLTSLLADAPTTLAASNGGSLLAPVSSLMGQKDGRKLLEQSVVTWEEDEAVSKCPFCQQEFGSWTFRRHHCRICGHVVCADPLTACSSEVSLNIKSPSSPRTEKALTNGESDQLHANIRMCRDCNHTIFSARDFAASLLYKPPDQRAYETLCQFERGIRLLLPSFHRVLMALQPSKLSNGETDLSKPPPTHAQIQEAAKIRKRLIDSFGKYGAAAKRMRNLQTDKPSQKRLQEAVYTYASGFLHTNMLPLKSLPQMLRACSTASPIGRYMSTPTHSASNLRHTELATSSDVDSQAPSDEASTVVSQLESEEKELKERLAVLQEQKFLVQDMMRMATGARRFEEASALSRNIKELETEIDELSARVDQVEQRWEGVYGNGKPA
ncbi:hypothetical protein CDD82_5516 [Ophiocordyceps australis]|uniref:FYVE-type domain-containing protein n=1 Tax=Ophiocordyceps australis TaxID=1399860 RepID=A0A2C5ZTB4_9HYPO|nr:hypothetical protein CDD82_5516 [Ophiocordyceps australis]